MKVGPLGGGDWSTTRPHVKSRKLDHSDSAVHTSREDVVPENLNVIITCWCPADGRSDQLITQLKVTWHEVTIFYTYICTELKPFLVNESEPDFPQTMSRVFNTTPSVQHVNRSNWEFKVVLFLFSVSNHRKSYIHNKENTTAPTFILYLKATA